MKKLLALLLAILLALPSGFALAEEDKTGLWDKVGESLNELRDKAQETAEDAAKVISEKAGEIAGEAQKIAEDTTKTVSEKAGEIAGQAQEKAQEAGKAISEKAEEIVGQAQEKGQEAGKAISEKAGEIADQAQEKAQEAGKAISEKAGEILGQAQEKAEEAGKAISEKAGEIAGQAQEKAQEAGKAISEKAGEIAGQAQEKAQEAGKAISEKAAEIAGQAQDKMDELSFKAKLGALKLAGKALQTWGNIQDAAEAGKEKAAELIDLAREGLPKVWENIKKTAAKAVEAVKDFIQTKLQQLLDWINGPKNADGQTAASRNLYFDVFYFGMPVSEAKALGLGDLTVDEENAVQVLLVPYEEPQGFAVILFSGLDDSAKLTEIVCVLYSDADTVTRQENGIDIQTTEETVKAIYDEIESWFTGLQAVELGDHLALPLYPGLTDEEETISRAVLYLYEDGEGYNAATHYVSTTDCGVNVLQYLYLNAAEAKALLAK